MTMMDEEEEIQGGKKVMVLIEKATNSTAPEVDPRLLKAIKTVVRFSNAELRVAAEILMDLMKRQHSQVRYLTLLIIDEIFMRSKLFRSLITENLDQLLSLSIGFRRNQPLPAPLSVATVLRTKAIEFLEKWNITFGIHYRQLRLGFDYLKNTLRYQFPNLQANAARTQQERREREIRTGEILRSKLETLRENFSSIKGEIKSTIDEIDECLEIVRTKDDGSWRQLDNNDGDEDYGEIRNPELKQIRTNALIEAEKVQENNDNKVVFDALREQYKLLVSKHLVTVQQWLSVLTRVEVEDNRFRVSSLKEFISIRNHIHAAKKKCEDSGCALLDTKADDEDDDIWEEGKIGMAENSVSPKANKHNEDHGTTSTSNKVSNKEHLYKKGSNGEDKVDHENIRLDTNPLRGKLLAEAPVLRWGPSLDDWGRKRDVLANQRGMELDGHWGRIDYDAVIPAEKIAELSVQATVYKEEQVEIQPCRAPLSKGGLCQRRDLRVCPFHGPIIPRDDEGNPISLQGVGRKPAETIDEAGPSTIEGSLTKEMSLDNDSQVSLVEKLAKQAMKNVRRKDREEINKREIYKQSLKRAKLAKVRQHNEAVLRQAAIASTSMSASIGEFVDANDGQGRSATRNKKPTLSSMLHKKVTTKDRLAQRLLSTRARDATIRQLSQGEDANYREAFANQW